jgi:hypothetical protein
VETQYAELRTTAERLSAELRKMERPREVEAS